MSHRHNMNDNNLVSVSVHSSQIRQIGLYASSTFRYVTLVGWLVVYQAPYPLGTSTELSRYVTLNVNRALNGAGR